ncbi:MAG: MlaD family protein [Deltaproteobacteria bacterium]|jgi:paraquat-inducible protein B|nr:MlaD family protein [Deltaproteobacteria bacterium]
MSKKANTTVIGSFVIGAVLLAVAGIVIFGGGRYFTKKYNYTAHFYGSVKGLNVGAPVLFRGVKVGEVTGIAIEYNSENMDFSIAVNFQLVSRATTIINREFLADHKKINQNDVMLDLVNRGLRAQLAPQSYITGLLYVKLEFFPGSEAPLPTTEAAEAEIESTEIPTIPSNMEELARTFENLPLQQIADNLEEMTAGIERLVNSPQLGTILKSVESATGTFDQAMVNLDTQLTSLAADLKTMINNTDRLIRSVKRQVEPVARGLLNTTDAATGAFNQAEETLSLTEGPGAELVAGIKQAVNAATHALVKADTTLETIDSLAGQDSDVIYSLNTALEEITLAARSIRAVAEYLERHPEALLRGKRGNGGK